MNARRILVVEDEPISQRVICQLLRANGYGVVTACDGTTAVSLAMAEQPDLIILDLGLPETDPFSGPHWDGFNVMEWLGRLSTDRKIPVIVLTAHDSAEVRERSMAAGAAAFFQKPVDPGEFLLTIKSALPNG